MGKWFGGLDWVEGQWYAVCTNDSGIVEEVGASVSFFIASRLETPSPLQRGCTGLGSMTRWAIDSGISSRIWCGKDSGGWRDGRLQLKITPAAL
jgi:hypothetical protein